MEMCIRDRVSGGLGREIQTSEISGSLACDGYASAISSLFGCPPVTSFSQNVGLVNMTGVVNRLSLIHIFGGTRMFHSAKKQEAD